MSAMVSKSDTTFRNHNTCAKLQFQSIVWFSPEALLTGYFYWLCREKLFQNIV